MCAFLLPVSKEQIKFVYSVLKWLQTKILNENWGYRVGKKEQTCLNLELITGKEISSYMQWRRFTCAENETVVRKILEVRESFESSRVHWSQERRDKVGENHMYWRSNSQQQTSAVRSVWWPVLCTMTFVVLFSRRKMWPWLLRIACGLPNISLTLKI